MALERSDAFVGRHIHTLPSFFLTPKIHRHAPLVHSNAAPLNLMRAVDRLADDVFVQTGRNGTGLADAAVNDLGEVRCTHACITKRT